MLQEEEEAEEEEEEEEVRDLGELVAEEVHPLLCGFQSFDLVKLLLQFPCRVVNILEGNSVSCSWTSAELHRLPFPPSTSSPPPHATSSPPSSTSSSSPFGMLSILSAMFSRRGT